MAISGKDIYERAHRTPLSGTEKAECQKEFEVYYFGRRVGHYRTDVLVEDTVIVELEAVLSVPLHRAQLISYLKGFDKPLGILYDPGSISGTCHISQQKRINPFEEMILTLTKFNSKAKKTSRLLLFMADRILITLGANYFSSDIPEGPFTGNSGYLTLKLPVIKEFNFLKYCQNKKL
ncbi:MAG: GxxExxY protein [Desulfobacterales bacterium]